jgi:myo-inositol-1(or 4)-monophosphatase
LTVSFDPDALLAAMTHAARDAGAQALAFFRHGARTSAGVESKAGGSPVTEADMLVDRLLQVRLGALLPAAGWLSEETADTQERLSRRAVFIVDPIDGTRAFVGGDPRWAVSIALVLDGAPVLGVLHLPALGETYTAAQGRGANLAEMALSVSPRTDLHGARIAGPKPLLDRLRQSGVAFEAEPKVPSLAYRFARVASGSLDAAVASTDAHDWDIAAADLILREAGGSITDLQGRVPLYNAPDSRHGVLVAAPLPVRDQLNAALRNGRDTAGRRQG